MFDCYYFSGSTALKCAVNPTGDCKICSYYEAIAAVPASPIAIETKSYTVQKVVKALVNHFRENLFRPGTIGAIIELESGFDVPLFFKSIEKDRTTYDDPYAEFGRELIPFFHKTVTRISHINSFNLLSEKLKTELIAWAMRRHQVHFDASNHLLHLLLRNQKINVSYVLPNFPSLTFQVQAQEIEIKIDIEKDTVEIILMNAIA